MSSKTTVFICAMCDSANIGANKHMVEGEQGEGYQLYLALQTAVKKSALASQVQVNKTSCMGGGCNAPSCVYVCAEAKQGMMFNQQQIKNIPAILEYLEKYIASKTGRIRKSNRPQCLQENVFARLPRVN